MADHTRFVPLITTGYYSLDRQTWLVTCPHCKHQQDVTPVPVLHDTGSDPVPVAVGCEQCKQALTVICQIEDQVE